MGDYEYSALILVVVGAIVVFILVLLASVVVPQRSEYIVQRLGKYSRTLGAGFHILIPVLDRIAYRRSLKEEVMDIPEQLCITRDNVSIGIDGVIYIQVVDSRLSAYGIVNYRIAANQLAQTSLRSAIGKIVLDKTFEERENINQQVVMAVDEASQNWGVKVLRYEIKDIRPPVSVMEAMERQMKAERDKRAEIAISEGDRQARINRAEGMRQEAIAISEGEKQKRINEAEGRAREIQLVAEATAQGVRAVAESLSLEGGMAAANLRVAEKYVTEFGNLAKEGNTMIIPSNMSDMASMVATAMEVVSKSRNFSG
ncbi:MAG: paraslipin [Desulfovibrio sp.]|nr:MAG: paraslipin [Desulfovibrio sp.]